MSFARYPEYTDSGVAWLGEVPTHWVVAPLKRNFLVTLGKMLQPDAAGPEDELIPYLRAANIQWTGVDVSDIKQMWLSPRDRAQLELQMGDLLVCEGGDVGRSCLWNNELANCSFQNSVNRVRAIENDSTRFLYYWMSTIKDKGYVDVLCNKSTIAHFTAEKVAAVPVPFPSVNEQIEIVTFLDREIAKIDALVAEQEKLITLLQEKRQAVISHAMAKGMDPNAPMKDSGVDWLGEVPAHWTVARLGYFATVENGTTPTRDVLEYWLDGEIPWLASGEVNKLHIFEAEEFITQAALDRCSLRLLPINTVVIGLIGQGKTRGMSALLHTPATINQNLAAVCPGSKVNSWFLLYAFHAMYDWLREAGRGGNQAAMNCEMLRSVLMPVPHIDEQTRIVEHINTALRQIDTLSAEAEVTTKLLRERRTALISAAVTGQIDVRHTAHL